MCRSQSELNKEIHKISMRLSNELPDLSQNTGSSSYKQEKIMSDFAECGREKKEYKGKWNDFSRELKKVGNMKMTVIPVIIRILGIVLKILTKEPEERQN